MKVKLPLDEMTISEKIGVMEEIWTDLSSPESVYSPPDWHGKVLEERRQLADSGDIKFTDWETAKKEIRDRTS